MKDHLQFELVTPERLAYAGSVEMVEVPGEEGDFGVLPGHAPFFSMIRPGIIRVHEADGGLRRYFIPSGYAEVNQQGCTVLAEHIRDMEDADPSSAAADLEKAQQLLRESTDELTTLKAEKAVKAAEAYQYAITHR